MKTLADFRYMEKEFVYLLVIFLFFSCNNKAELIL